MDIRDVPDRGKPETTVMYCTFIFSSVLELINIYLSKLLTIDWYPPAESCGGIQPGTIIIISSWHHFTIKVQNR